MKRRLTLAIALLFALWTVALPKTAKAIDCQSGTINGDEGVSNMDIDCGQGHDCIIQICEGCIECCCVEDGGNAYCTYCDYQYCTMVTLGCG